jgi:hypothetical protein
MNDLTDIQKEKLLELLFKMGHQSMWKTKAVVNWLTEIGVEVSSMNNDKTLVFLNQSINVMEPVWGEAGIYAPTLAYAIALNENINYESSYTGSGFIFKDLLDKIAINWKLNVRFM